MNNIIAFKGNVTLDKAIWDNIWGMYATFDLEQAPQDKNNANPFKKFTKMKKGKVGTRFGAVFTFADESTAYQDEVMLKGWNDGTTGWRVTLWMNADSHGLHPFMSLDKGQELALVMAELDDDNEVIDQVQRERVTEAKKHRKQGLSNYAALLCRTPEFWLYLRNEVKLDAMWTDTEYPPQNAEEISAEWICSELCIDSRSELDRNHDAADGFHKHIRGPYAEWTSRRA